jgi:choline dehydrogenase-like flavoprotein
MPFRSNDLEQRPWVPLSGWPLTVGELAPYEERAAATFGFAPFPAPRPDGPLVRLQYRFPDNPQVFVSMYFDLLPRPLFTPELGATALELQVRGDRVDAVRFAGEDGSELTVRADTVVLATGAIENARILLLHERTIPTSGMTGRCFMEHPHVLAGRVRLPDPEPFRACLEGVSSLEVLALADDALAEGGLLNASVQLRPTGWDHSASGPVECELYVRAEQAPNPDSRLLLGDAVDRFGFAQPFLRWNMLENDWATVVRTSEKVLSLLAEQHGAEGSLRIGLDDPWPDVPAGPSDSWNSTWGNHHMGTTRMAESQADGVVDPNGLLHGTANLYVAGSGVFPTGGCANPTFMIVALAHRLVDQLAAA